MSKSLLTHQEEDSLLLATFRESFLTVTTWISSESITSTKQYVGIMTCYRKMYDSGCLARENYIRCVQTLHYSKNYLSSLHAFYLVFSRRRSYNEEVNEREMRELSPMCFDVDLIEEICGYLYFHNKSTLYYCMETCVNYAICMDTSKISRYANSLEE